MADGRGVVAERGALAERGTPIEADGASDLVVLADAPPGTHRLLVLRRDGAATRWPAVLFAALLLAAASRAPYVLLHGRFYAEEGSTHFAYMFLHHGWGRIFYVQTQTGYYNLFCDAATFLASTVSLLRAPLVTVWLSFGALAAVVWVALRWPSELLPTAASRVAAATLVVVGTVAVPEVWLNSITAHAYLGIFAVLVLFVDVTRLRRRSFAAGAIGLAVAGLSGVYTCVLAPFYVHEAVRTRSRRRIAYASIVVAGAAIQLAIVVHTRVTGEINAAKMRFPGLGVMLRDIAGWHFTTFLFGGSIATTLHSKGYSLGGLLALGAFAAVVFLFLVVVLVTVPSGRVALMLLGAFVLEEFLVNYGALNGAGGRYSVLPIAILTLMLVHGAATCSAPRLAGVATALVAVVLVAGVANFWTTKPALLRCERCPSWSAQVHEWEAGRRVQLTIWPYPSGHWVLRLPRPARPARPHAPGAGRAAERRRA